MLDAPRILVASAFGRGHWLSARLSQMGFQVQLIDVTEKLGSSTREDQEGPFGFFALREWERGEAEALNALGPTQEVSGGFTLWLKSGPWELRSSSSIHRARVLKQYDRAWPMVHQFGDVVEDRKLWIDKLQPLHFEERWIASLAADILSNQSQWSHEAYLKSVPTSLFERYFSRTPEQRNHSASLKWCADRGVMVIENAEIPDLAIEHRKVLGLEVRTNQSHFVRCHHLIWMLTSMETAHLSPRAFLKIYKGQQMEPEWCWLRYKLDFETSMDISSLPEEFLLIEDLHLPWAHDNYVLFRQSLHENSYHVWMKLPYSQRFHRDYLQDRIQPLMENLQKRNSRLKISKMHLPSEATSHLKELGAPLFPVYRAEDLARPLGVDLKNLKLSHPESWPSYSWGTIFSSQQKITSELRQWWSELNQEQKQRELRL